MRYLLSCKSIVCFFIFFEIYLDYVIFECIFSYILFMIIGFVDNFL